MAIFSYVVARDYGFAPNPFWGVCTLATCKPDIRKHASVGDWVIGTGSAKYDLQGQIVFAMLVEETLTYNEYWDDVRFRQKRPNLRGSLKQAFGDNIYRSSANGEWLQANSHHSRTSGVKNSDNVTHDTRVPRVLIGEEFYYWGRNAQSIPGKFKGPTLDLCKKGPGYKKLSSADTVNAVAHWLRTHYEPGYSDEPSEFATELSRTAHR